MNISASMKRNQTLCMTIPRKTLWVDAAYLGVILSTVGFLVYLLGTVLYPFFAACFASYLLTPVVDSLERRGLSRFGAVGFLYGIFFVAMTGMTIYLLPTLDREVRTLRSELPHYSYQVQERLILLQGKVEREFPELEQLKLTGRAAKESSAYLAQLSERLPQLLLDAFTLASIFLLIPFFTWYLLLEGAAIKKSLIGLVPNRYFEATLNLIYRINQHLSRYMLAVLVEAICVGLLSGVAYSMIGVRFGIVIGILSGIATPIPYVGPVVGALAALLVIALEESFMSQLLHILLIASVIYMLDHLVIKPTLMSKTADLHPLTILLVLIIGGNVFGFWGLVLGIPILCVVKIFLQELLGVLRRQSTEIT
jgi:putative permease